MYVSVCQTTRVMRRCASALQRDAMRVPGRRLPYARNKRRTYVGARKVLQVVKHTASDMDGSCSICPATCTDRNRVEASSLAADLRASDSGPLDGREGKEPEEVTISCCICAQPPAPALQIFSCLSPLLSPCRYIHYIRELCCIFRRSTLLSPLVGELLRPLSFSAITSSTGTIAHIKNDRATCALSTLVCARVASSLHLIYHSTIPSRHEPPMPGATDRS